MNYERLKGMVAASFTPFTTAGEVDYDAIDQYADWVASSPISGVFVNGTTGEFMSLTLCERKTILERWVNAAAKRFKVIAHVGTNCQKDGVELASHAASIGVDAIASIAPSFFKPSSLEELIGFFEPMAKAAEKLPFYYYNMPSMSGVNLPVDQFLTQGKIRIPNLVGTKFTHNNFMEMATCLELNGGEFEVLHGYDELLVCGTALGAVAGVGSTYNYIPKVYERVFKAMENSDLAAARSAQMDSVRVVEVIIKHGGGVRGGKAIMKVIGVDCGDCRSPIPRFSTAEYDRLLKELESINFSKMQ